MEETAPNKTKIYKPIVIVDEQDQVVGAMQLPEALSLQAVRRGVRVFLRRSTGEIFIQQRSNNVFHPRLFDQSAAGHVDADESYEEAAGRELQEELGVSTALRELEHIFLDEPDPIKGPSHLCYAWIKTYVGEYDGELTLDPEEVAGGQWMRPEEIDYDLAHDAERYVITFWDTWKRCRHHFL